MIRNYILSSWKLLELDRNTLSIIILFKQLVLDINSKLEGKYTNSEVTFFYRPQHIDVPALAKPQELTYNSFVQTQNIVWKTYREWWMIGTKGEGESGKSVVVVWLDDNGFIFCLFVNLFLLIFCKIFTVTFL